MVLLLQMVVCYLGGALLLAMTIGHLSANAHGAWPAPEDVLAVWKHFAGAGALLATGALLHGVAETCKAIRDIAARNGNA
jgi:hypothetical protein